MTRRLMATIVGLLLGLGSGAASRVSAWERVGDGALCNPRVYTDFDRSSNLRRSTVQYDERFGLTAPWEAMDVYCPFMDDVAGASSDHASSILVDVVDCSNASGVFATACVHDPNGTTYSCGAPTTITTSSFLGFTTLSPSLGTVSPSAGWLGFGHSQWYATVRVFLGNAGTVVGSGVCAGANVNGVLGVTVDGV